MIIKPQKVAEFSLINEYFKKRTIKRSDVLLGIGDDAALLRVPPGQLTVMAADTLVAGVHFPLHTAPYDIGYKALAVNLSDLAAMAAEPAWMMLVLTMPKIDNTWLDEFSAGLFALANQFNVQLIGGDSTSGALVVTVQVTGWLPSESAGLYRHGAKVGDKIYVSGTLGDAGLGLQVAKQQRTLSQMDQEYVLSRLNRPTPRVKLGMLLRDIASSAIDISDGLLADLTHLLTASNVGATVDAECIPLSAALRSNLNEQEAIKLALTSGDDYELCFIVSKSKLTQLNEALKLAEVRCTCIGEITNQTNLIDLVNTNLTLNALGFTHWS